MPSKELLKVPQLLNSNLRIKNNKKIDLQKLIFLNLKKF